MGAGDEALCDAQVCDELFLGPFPVDPLEPQDVGWMDGHQYRRRRGAPYDTTAQCAHPTSRAKQRTDSGRPETDDQRRRDRRDFPLEPLQAGGDFPLRRRFVQAALASRHPFEMLDGIGHVHRGARDAGYLEGLVENAAGRSDERVSRAILDIARLFADQYQPGFARTFTEYGLGCVLP